jgi:nicotinamide mononucleotide transporter
VKLGLEIAANVLTALSIWLAGRNRVHTWWTGMVAGALFAVVFLESRLYADVVLQGFFLVTSAIGWWQWLHGDHGRALRVGRVRRGVLAAVSVAGALGAWGYGALLHAFTDAYAPFADSTVLAFSVIAQVLLMRRRLESWPFWLLVNTIAVPLYASRGLLLTSVLYAAYWVNALVSWRTWRRLC